MEFRETPLRHLRGVELGMTAKRLEAVRPAAKFAPYLGMQERIPGYTVSYQFPSTTVDQQAKAVPIADPLQSVFITESFDSMEKAEATWREKVLAVSSAHRAPTACEHFSAGGQQARWLIGKHALVIGVFPKEAIAPTITSRVIYAISSVETMKQPAGATKTACPNR